MAWTKGPLGLPHGAVWVGGLRRLCPCVRDCLKHDRYGRMVQHALDFGQRERRVFMPQAMQDNDAQVVDANRDFQQAGIDASLFAPEVRQVALSITEGGNVQAQGVWLIEDEGNEGDDTLFHATLLSLRNT